MQSNPESRSQASGRLVFGIALVVGLVVRLAILGQTGALGAGIGDEKHYTALATNILQGHGFAWGPGRPTSIRPPLYPAVLAAIWRVASSAQPNFQVVRLIQIGLALLTTGLVYLLGRRTFGAPVGRFAAAVFWLYPSYIFFNFLILTETLFIFLLVAFVLSAVMLIQTPRPRIALICGLLLGLAALTRSVLWPLPLVFCPLLTFLFRTANRSAAPDGSSRSKGSWTTSLVLPAFVFLGYAVVIVPWAVRNTRLQHVVTIVDTMGGMNLRMGNYEYTPEDRMWDAVSLTGEREWSYALTQEHPAESMTEGQKEKWAQHKAVEYMLANPGTTVRRALIKFADLWGIEREFIAGVQQGLFVPPAWFATLAAIAIVVSYLGVALLGAAGLWLSAPRWREHCLLLLPLLVMTAVHTVVFGHSRYHLPLIPILALYAASFVHARAHLFWRAYRPALLGATVTVLALVAIWVRQVVLVDADRIRAVLSHVI